MFGSGRNTTAGRKDGLKPLVEDDNGSLLSLPADMLKDVIQEYDEYFSEIIEQASYALEKVKGYPLGDGHNGELLNGTKVYTSLCREPQRLTNSAPSPCR